METNLAKTQATGSSAINRSAGSGKFGENVTLPQAPVADLLNTK